MLHPDKRNIESCAILTTQANSILMPIHERMPVILEPNQFEQWLDLDNQNIHQLKAMLVPYDAKLIETYPVGSQVNKPSNNTPDCIKSLKRIDD